MMIKLNSIDKTQRGEGHWARGAEVLIRVDEIAAVVPMVHSYHSFRRTQDYSVVVLKSGEKIEVMHDSRDVMRRIEYVAQLQASE